MEIYALNPFSRSLCFESPYYVVGNFKRLTSLNSGGMLVLANSIDTLDRERGTIKINVREMCVNLFKEYDNALANRIRRGTQNLILNVIIKCTDEKDVYWLNPAVIWIR